MKRKVIIVAVVFSVVLFASCDNDASGPEPVAVAEVILSLDNLVMEPDESATLTATVLPADATNKAVTWTSSDPGVATVDNGVVTGVAAGNTTVTVSTADGGKTASCAITVKPKVSGVSLNHNSLVIGIGTEATGTLTAVVTPDGADKSVTWTSNAPEVATVDQTGIVTGVAVGDAIITVTTEDGGFKDTCEVTVVFVVTSESEWTAALSSISGTEGGTDGNPTVFIINITGNVSVPGITSGSSITGNYKEVRLTGSGTLSLGSTSNGSIILVTANQTFIIDGPTLQGKAGNNTSLIYIGGGSAVKLRSGYIKGNDGLADGDGRGGGVLVYNGNFKMTGGTVSGNTSGMGGGVYVVNGNFTMTGGKISGNKALAGAGGGVYVASGNFTMTGGEISGNEADGEGYDISSVGGGVAVEENANFSMTGGFIYGNEAAVSVQLKNNADIGAAAFIQDAQEPAINDTMTQYPPNP